MPILDAIMQMCSSKYVFCKYAGNFWKSICGRAHFWYIACSTRDFQKFATYLQNKNASGNFLGYLKEHH